MTAAGELTERTADQTRPPPRQRHDLPHLDAVRGVAALAIVVHHCASFAGGMDNPWLGGWYRTADWGVTLFFALSGFLLFRAWVRAAALGRPGVAVGDYLWRRGVRIFPALLLTCAAVWMLSAGARTHPERIWLLTLVLQQNYVSSLFVQVPELAHLWSLSTEFGFYLLLPVLARLVLGRAGRNRPGRVLLSLGALALVAVFWTAAFRLWPPFTATSAAGAVLGWTPAFLDWFAVGMLLAWWRERPGGPPAAARWAADAWWCCWTAAGAGLVVLAAGFWATESALGDFMQPTLRHVLYGLVALLVLLPLTVSGTTPLTRVTLSLPLRWLGRLSYGVFLWHMPLVQWIVPQLGRHGVEPTTLVVFLAVLPPTLLLSYLTWAWVERPVMDRLRTPRDVIALFRHEHAAREGARGLRGTEGENHERSGDE